MGTVGFGSLMTQSVVDSLRTDQESWDSRDVVMPLDISSSCFNSLQLLDLRATSLFRYGSKMLYTASRLTLRVQFQEWVYHLTSVLRS